MKNLAKITTQFESGNFIVHEITENKIIGEIKPDPNNKDFQWFYFTIENQENLNLELIIKNINLSSYPTAWENYQLCIKHESQTQWQAIDTVILDNNLHIRLSLEKGETHIAYFIPYTLHQHALLSQRISGLPQFLQKFSAYTHQNREIEIFNLGKNQKNCRNIWLIARQHPGESIVGWFMEGLTESFESQPHPVNPLQFFIVHNMNPDGVFTGTHRTNSTGIDLNRGWPTDSIETQHIQHWMQTYPPAIFFDIHGDERTINPYFICNLDTPPDYNDLLNRLTMHENLEIRITPSTSNDLRIGRNFVQNKFGALALTLELPCQYHKNMNADNLIHTTKQLAKKFLATLRE